MIQCGLNDSDTVWLKWQLGLEASYSWRSLIRKPIHAVSYDFLLCVLQVPGLFEGDEYTTLMTQCKEGSQRDGLMLDSSEELYKWFTEQVHQNSELICQRR